MKKEIAILSLVALFFCACSQGQNNNDMQKESPLSIVIKLETAESYRDYEIASKFIDIESVYKEISEEENKKSEEVWKEYVEFNFKLGQSSKFSNIFPFHKYKIIETVKGNVAIIQLISIQENQGVQEIKYTLQEKEGVWVVTKREYKKAE